MNENDLLRERLTNNIGQASDQSVSSFSLIEHVVVSVPAGTEIYVILQRTAKEKVTQSPRANSQLQISNQSSMDELHQLLQLQREMKNSDRAVGVNLCPVNDQQAPHLGITQIVFGQKWKRCAGESLLFRKPRQPHAEHCRPRTSSNHFALLCADIQRINVRNPAWLATFLISNVR